MERPSAIFNWSGGKDSSFALQQVLQENTFDIKYLLTSVNTQHKQVSMHGVREELLEKQGEAIGIPLKKLLLPEAPSMEEYNLLMTTCMNKLKEEGITHSIFGDIFLEDLKKYREEQLEAIDMKAVFPLWKRNTKELANEFIQKGFKAVIVCVNEKHLGQSFCGRMLDEDFLHDLPANVDPCGENGEYHSFVFDGPIFKKPVDFKKGEIVHRIYSPRKDDCEMTNSVNYDTGFYFCDLLPA